MKQYESKKRYDRRYKAERVKRLHVDLYPTDVDIIEYLELISAETPKATFIKNLIRERMKK